MTHALKNADRKENSLSDIKKHKLYEQVHPEPVRICLEGIGIK
jgi:hypothetical protein